MMFSGTMRKGLHGRLVKAGVPYGLADLIAEANYPGGSANGLVNCAPRGRARDLTCGFLEQGLYSLEQVTRGIFGSDYDEAIAFSDKVDATADFIGQVRRGDLQSAGSGTAAHLPATGPLPQSDPNPGHLPSRSSSTARSTPEPPAAESDVRPEGWYDDPTEPATTSRWWNGSAWTEHQHAKQ